MNEKWTRVSRASPCPICHKPDWCCVGERYVNCMRVVSDKVCKNGGYLHALDERDKHHHFDVTIRIEPPRPNFAAHCREWSYFTDHASVTVLANKLGVSPLALRCLGVVWTGENWAFPMRDKYGEICGIQIRHDNDFKQTMRGSRVGYFLPDCPADRTAYVCEGASDCASALTLGLYAVGRYNCAQCGVDLGQYLRRKQVRDVVIVADNDAPGIAGAEKLCNELKMHSCIYTPPCKDLRSMVNLGGTRKLIESTVSNLIWRQP